MPVGQLVSLVSLVIDNPRSSLPDDVFDPGERQKQALKRPIQKVNLLKHIFLDFDEDFPSYKGTEKTEKGSPDLPNKRRK